MIQSSHVSTFEVVLKSSIRIEQVREKYLYPPSQWLVTRNRRTNDDMTKAHPEVEVGLAMCRSHKLVECWE